MGKTTLADILADRLKADRMRDVDDNPFLKGFYHEKSGPDLTSQMHSLVERFRQYRDLDVSCSANATICSDYILETE